MKQLIYLAGGCFWGMQKYLDQIDGVCETEVGFANGKTLSPTYREVCQDDTGHAETVRVVFDNDKLSLEKLLHLYFEAIDPTSLNQQGEDTGVQYRTGIYFTDTALEQTIRTELNALQKHYDKPIVVECMELQNFYPAEEYHQKYLEKNPEGYCHLKSEMFQKAYEESRK